MFGEIFTWAIAAGEAVALLICIFCIVGLALLLGALVSTPRIGLALVSFWLGWILPMVIIAIPFVYLVDTYHSLLARITIGVGFSLLVIFWSYPLIQMFIQLGQEDSKPLQGN